MLTNSTLYNAIYEFFALSPIMLLFCFVGPASSDESPDLLLQGIASLYQAYDNWDEEMFRQSLAKVEMAAQKRRKDGLAEYWSGATYFFLSLYNLFTPGKAPDKTHGTENAKKGIEILTISIERNPNFSESYAIRGVLREIMIKMKSFSVFKQGPNVGKDR